MLFRSLEQAQAYARRYGWFLKLDIRKYFDSVDHAVLRAMLSRKFKDAALLKLFDRIIASYRTAEGRGIPIGNLASQFFANAYLGLVDHFVKETLRIPGYVRYMDDMALWSDDKGELKCALKAIDEFLHVNLTLCFKDFPYMNRCLHGMDFLGFRVTSGQLRVGRRAGRRLVRRMKGIERDLRTGRVSEVVMQERATSMLAFVGNADSWTWRKRRIDFGEWPQRLQPRQPGRQLEQHGVELPVSKPQQQRPVQPQQQSRLSPCP